MRTIRILLGGLVLAAFPALASGPSAYQPPLEIQFGVYQADTATTVYAKFNHVIDALETPLHAALGQPVDIKLNIFKTYDDGIDALVSDKIDFVRFGPASYITARKRNPRIQLVAMEQENGQKRFKGLIVVAAASPVKTIADLKGRTFAFGDPNSTIGRYLVQAELVRAGIHAKDLKHFDYLDRHDKVAKAVQMADYDAGSIKSGTFDAMPPGSLRVIASFDNVTKPWVVAAKLDKKIVDALRNGLLAFHDEAALKTLGISGFVAADDSEYQIVRDGMEAAAEFER